MTSTDYLSKYVERNTDRNRELWEDISCVFKNKFSISEETMYIDLSGWLDEINSVTYYNPKKKNVRKEPVLPESYPKGDIDALFGIGTEGLHGG